MAEGMIKRLHHTLLDIKLIKEYLCSMGPNGTMNMTDLTTKVCFLLSICGLMRADDLACMDAEKCMVTSAEVMLKVIIPKEKRGGQCIEKTIIVTTNSDEMLCPVQAFNEYHMHTTHADKEARWPHHKDPEIDITPLL